MSNTYTFFNVIKDIITGKLRFASKNVAKQRILTCKNCNAYNNFRKQCTVCGCLMPLKVKFVESKCPMELWKE